MNFVLAGTMTFAVVVPVEIVKTDGYMGIPEKSRQRKQPLHGLHTHQSSSWVLYVPPSSLT